LCFNVTTNLRIRVRTLWVSHTINLFFYFSVISRFQTIFDLYFKAKSNEHDRGAIPSHLVLLVMGINLTLKPSSQLLNLFIVIEWLVDFITILAIRLLLLTFYWYQMRIHFTMRACYFMAIVNFTYYFFRKLLWLIILVFYVIIFIKPILVILFPLICLRTIHNTSPGWSPYWTTLSTVVIRLLLYHFNDCLKLFTSRPTLISANYFTGCVFNQSYYF
jgi:hypothetical protein